MNPYFLYFFPIREVSYFTHTLHIAKAIRYMLLPATRKALPSHAQAVQKAVTANFSSISSYCILPLQSSIAGSRGFGRAQSVNGFAHSDMSTRTVCN